MQITSAHRQPPGQKLVVAAGADAHGVLEVLLKDDVRQRLGDAQEVALDLDAARLDLALGRPVLVVDSTDVDTDGKPIVTKRSRFAAERIEFVVENS